MIVDVDERDAFVDDDDDDCDRFDFMDELSYECVPKLESGTRFSMRIFSPFLSTTVTFGAGMRADRPVPVCILSVA